jgi:peptide/nickel transport system substrate-binding protein
MPDQTSRWNSLEAREIHVAYTIDPEQAERLERAGFKVINQPVGQAFQYFFRTTVKSPLSDVRVRRAINYAVDKEGIVKVAFAGQTRVLQGQPVGLDAHGFDPDIKAYAYDVARAKALMAGAGYPNGFSIQLDVGIGFAPRAKEVAEVISDQLRKAGINVEILLNERGVYLDKLANAKMAPMWELSLNYAPTFDLLSVLNNFICNTLHKSHCDPQFDALYKKWAATFEPAEQRKLSSQALRYINDEALSLFLWQVPGIYMVAPTVEGLKMRGDYTMDLTQVVITGR